MECFEMKHSDVILKVAHYKCDGGLMKMVDVESPIRTSKNT